MTEGPARPSLLCLAGSSFCALPLEHVVETIRPLAIEPLAGAPAFVAGFSIVRGKPLPVVSVSRLLGGKDETNTRLVVVRTGIRQVGLLFSGVIGLRTLSANVFSGLPPLLERSSVAASEIGALDSQLVLLLDTARLVPDDVFAMLEALELAS